MPKLIISRNAQVVREVELDKERTTIGRHPGNDIVIDHGTVSSRHAAITLVGNEAVLEDLGSTNGTFVNGRRIEKHRLANGDRAVMALFQLDFIASPAAPAAAPAQAEAPSAPAQPAAPATPAQAATPAVPAHPLQQAAVPASPAPAPTPAGPPSVPIAPATSQGAAAFIEVMSGVNAGRKLELGKPLTTLGSPGVLVVVIARQGSHYTLSQIDGGTSPLVNGVAIPKEGVSLSNGDMINLAGTSMRFSAAA